MNGDIYRSKHWDGGPGAYKVGQPKAPSKNSTKSVPVNLLKRHTQKILSQPDGWENDTSDYALPPGSLLLKSPRRTNSAGGGGSSRRPAEHRQDGSSTATKPLVDHYRALLFGGDDSDEEGDLRAGSRKGDLIQTNGQDTGVSSESVFLFGPKDVLNQKGHEQNQEHSKPEKRIFNKYKANIVPKGMKRPPHSYVAQPVVTSPAEASIYYYDPGSYQPESGNGPRHPQSDQPNGYQSPQGDTATPYFSYGQDENGNDQNDYDDELPPSLHEQEQHQKKSNGRRRSSQGLESRVQFTPQAEQGRSRDEVDGEDYGENVGEKDEDNNNMETEDDNEGHEEEEEEEDEDEDEDDINGRIEELRRKEAERLSAEYVQVITQLTEELGKAQERIEELEEQREQERQELENELEEIDKGNLDLTGRAVALQRQVMQLTSERQDNLLRIQKLSSENQKITANFSKIEEIARMLQKKTEILEKKLQVAQSKQAESSAIRSATSTTRAGRPQPGSLEEALEQIANLEDLNKALRENLKVSREQLKQQSSNDDQDVETF